MNILTYFNNWLKLSHVQHIINRYLHFDEPRIKLKYKPLLKRPFVETVELLVGSITVGLLVVSQKKGSEHITYVEYIWVNPNIAKVKGETVIPYYYESLYGIFIQWYNIRVKDNKHNKIAISINVTKEQQVERFRRLLTINGFSEDAMLTIAETEFKAPYRDKEEIINIVYSRVV
jgi:hypothetical protein